MNRNTTYLMLEILERCTTLPESQHNMIINLNIA